MIDIELLEEKFSIEGEVGFAELENDLVFVTVSNKFADADICLYGAHVTHFRTHKTMDILWMSPDSNFEVGTPIRGGIPVCFPWFGMNKANPESPQHGFGRLMYWNMEETQTLPTGETLVRMSLSSSTETKKYWEYDFYAEVTVIVGKTLTVSLKVENTSNKTFEYGCALHSYFNLSAIENLSVYGLQNTRYFNQLDQNEYIQETETLEIKQAETRHYLDTETDCILHDPVFNRNIQISKSGSRITTVWNPWDETCANIGDLPDDAYETFVCLETVNSFNNLIRLEPGQSHETKTIIGIEE